MKESYISHRRVPIEKQYPQLNRKKLVDLKGEARKSIPGLSVIAQAIQMAQTKKEIRQAVSQAYYKGIAPPAEYQTELQRLRRLRLAQLRGELNRLIKYQEEGWKDSGPTPMSDLGTGTVGNDI